MGSVKDSYTEEDLKAERQRGYSNGYNAGLKRAKNENKLLLKKIAHLKVELSEATRPTIQAAGAEQYNQAFCAALSGLVQTNSWKIGDRKVSNSTMYAELASRMAEKSMEYMKGVKPRKNT